MVTLQIARYRYIYNSESSISIGRCKVDVVGHVGFMSPSIAAQFFHESDVFATLP